MLGLAGTSRDHWVQPHFQMDQVGRGHISARNGPCFFGVFLQSTFKIACGARAAVQGADHSSPDLIKTTASIIRAQDHCWQAHTEMAESASNHEMHSFQHSPLLRWD